MMNSLAGYPLDELSCVWVMLLCMLKRAYCMCVVRIYKSDSPIQNVYLHFSRTYLKDLGAESDPEKRNFTEICSAQERLF